MAFQYRQIPLQVSATQNEYHSPREMTTAAGLVVMVPAGFWLVEDSTGEAWMFSGQGFRTRFEKYQEPTPLESFANTLLDLRNSDRMAVVRANELDDRIAALETMASTMRNAIVNQG